MNSNLLELRKFVVPEFIFGLGALNLAGRYAKNLGIQKALVVTDAGIIKHGWTKRVTHCLDEENIEWTIFSDVAPNPTDKQVSQGTALYEEENCNGIIAVGGGSPIYCAKGIGIVAANGSCVLDYEGVDMVKKPVPPMLCIPTTAGTSADVFQFAIITGLERKVKIAIISKMVVPDISLIDPETTTTKDAYLTACTGMDALTHAIEAYVSNAGSPITDLYAYDAIKRISQFLIPAVQNLQDINLRSQMMLASFEAGIAFSNASLGAVHAIAHSLGGLLDMPHGECNALLLAHVVRVNFESDSYKYTKIAEAIGIHTDGSNSDEIKNELLSQIKNMRENVGIIGGLSQIGVNIDVIPKLSHSAVKDPCIVTNPLKLDVKDIEGIYERALTMKAGMN